MCLYKSVASVCSIKYSRKMKGIQPPMLKIRGTCIERSNLRKKLLSPLGVHASGAGGDELVKRIERLRQLVKKRNVGELSLICLAFHSHHLCLSLVWCVCVEGLPTKALFPQNLSSACLQLSHCSPFPPIRNHRAAL